MKQLLIFLSIAVLLVSCGVKSEQQVELDDQTATEVTKTPEAVDTPEMEVSLDDSKVYPFMELKELYNVNWKGESSGNAGLDGKTVTITGEVFNSTKMSKYVDGGFEVTGAKLEFRGGEFTDPDFGHDVECVFPADQAEAIAGIEDGTMVTVKGVIEKQEGYIEPGFSYKVLTLKDCELVQE